ncbi:MAG TPA: putative transporter [Niabella sp.]|jgi:putative transport protein|nr:putative transporter [Chitinophagaceae bacterium]HRN46612.1 putative transporter [Niabella sp.]HRO85720.1 putative transporter [Niabella sp.]
MNWFVQLFTEHSVAQTVLVYGLLISIGIILGKVKIFGTSLGVTWILFIGLIASYFKIDVNIESVHFLRDFGLILFVYSIGLQVGPGFFSSLKSTALITNLLAASIVILGILITVGFIYTTGTPFNEMVGVMSGAVTNTPGLGAAQAAINDLKIPGIDGSKMTLAYALAYPFGVFGIILTFIILKKIFRVSIPREQELHRRLNALSAKKVVSFHLVLENEGLDKQPLRTIFELLNDRIIVSRIKKADGEFVTPNPETILGLGDVLLIVTPRHLRKKLKVVIGSESEIDLRTQPNSVLMDRTVVVTQTEVTHKRLGDIAGMLQDGFTLTRLSRAGIEILPHGDLYLQLGDRVKIVGTKEGVDKATAILGNSVKKLDIPEIAPIFLGIVLGVILGSIPFNFPNIPIPVKIGLAGGPLIVALLLSRFGGKFYLNNYITYSANLMLRELGICLFLASVGLASGKNLGQAFSSGEGWYWMAMGAAITMIPLLIVGFIAHKVYKKTYFETCGLLAGASTDPPALAFAIKTAGNDIPSNTYATVYPLTMILRIVGAQMLILLFGS